jgi:hypothetical protein
VIHASFTLRGARIPYLTLLVGDSSIPILFTFHPFPLLPHLLLLLFFSFFFIHIDWLGLASFVIQIFVLFDQEVFRQVSLVDTCNLKAV